MITAGTLAEQKFLENGEWIDHSEQNIIDLGLIGPDGTQVGASGSDKTEITVSEEYATPGYQPCRILPGQWQVIVGAYKVEPDGVTVYYEVILEAKSRRLLKGDLHAHTLASDGVHTLEELAFKAKRNGLDFVAVTDHNQLVAKNSLPRLPGVTLIPGVEWTHFKGHANFLGVDQPYDTSFMANSPAEVQAKFGISSGARCAHHHQPSVRTDRSFSIRSGCAALRLHRGVEWPHA